jgi:hypothetical protein
MRRECGFGKQMVLGTANPPLKNTLESQFSPTVGVGDF